MSKYRIFIILLVCFLNESYGQQTQLNLITYTSREGLSFSDINNSEFDRHGFLWIATNYGLNRFDGATFNKYYSSTGRQSSGLSGNIIKKIACDSLVLWAAVEDEGINCYFDQIDHFVKYTHNPADSGSLVSNKINCLHLSADKKLYIGTAAGLSIFRRDVTHFTNIRYNPSSKTLLEIMSFTESENNIIWIGTNAGGILYYDNYSGIHEVINLPNYLKKKVITGLLYDKKDSLLWIATNQGLWCAVRKADNTLYNWHQPVNMLLTTNILCIRENSEGDIWTGTLNNGLYVRSASGSVSHFTANTYDINGLVSNEVKDISFGADGSVWLSTPKGLQGYYKVLQQFPSFKTNISSNGSKIPAASSGLCLWHNYIVACTNQGVWFSDTNFLKPGSIFIAGDDGRKARFTTANVFDDKIYLASSNGAYQLLISSDKTNLIRPPELGRFNKYISKSCREIIKANDSVYWISAINGYIYQMNILTGKADTLYAPFINNIPDLNSGVFVNLYKDKDGRLIAGTNNGINIYNNTGQLMYKVLQKNGISSFGKNEISDFYDDGKYIWMATSGKGFWQCTRNMELIKQYSTENGLCDNSVISIQGDYKGNLWLATRRGLAFFNITTKKFINYDQQHGLPAQEFNIFGKAAFNTSTLYFSNNEGIVQIHPADFIHQNPVSPSPIVNKIILGNEIMSRGDLAVINEMPTLFVRYNENISLSITILNFLKLYDFSLQYKLDENNNWLDMVSGAEIIVSNLSPGIHKLRVRTVINGEGKNERALILTIFVKPVFYQKSWFIALCLLVSGIIIYGIYKYRVNQLLKMQAIRNSIARDLHDDVGSTLGSINMYTEVAAGKLEKHQPTEAEDVLRKIGLASREMIERMSDIVWSINARNDRFENLYHRMHAFAAAMFSPREIEFIFDVQGELNKAVFSMKQRKNIFLIFKEAIYNIVKYADSKKVTINFRVARNDVMMVIKDDGKGFDYSLQNPGINNGLPEGNGIKNMKARAIDINAALDIRSVINEGTTIILKFQI